MTGKKASKKTHSIRNVDDYLASIPEKAQITLEALREAIKAAAPDAKETIRYHIPTYEYHGPIVHFMAHDKYYSLIVTSRAVLEKIKGDLVGYDISGTTIHFSDEHPLPSDLVKRIVAERVRENKVRAESGK